MVNRAVVCGLSESEVDSLESLLDNTFKRKGEKSGTAVRSFDPDQGRWHAGRIFVYSHKPIGRAEFRASMGENGSYMVELTLEINDLVYREFLSKCQRDAPSVYAELSKTEEMYRAAL